MIKSSLAIVSFDVRSWAIINASTTMNRRDIEMPGEVDTGRDEAKRLPSKGDHATWKFWTIASNAHRSVHVYDLL